ncbi:hypothetical protein SIAM614_29921 [Stappia aggregata IAM 12614]|uniref:Uncharacterized protein n=1 Tax=Roseibium aggregatum (strain ATCC 25650 / DSM 13394 / JCM 20685 / NBRC 16684 / NCIMB 2208 / IAM 12614 / B1) TaxID=384765 RepID=A0P1V6_ROSAI|nr:hypothetical protein SIAM614_29921 [Stappia aggregata IAM 12614] [Roseibium aggregatum IAM 12614]
MAKLHLASVRHLVHWMVTGQVAPNNPAHSVGGPSYSMKNGKMLFRGSKRA